MQRRKQDTLEQGWKRLAVGGLIAQGSLVERWYDRTVKTQRHRYGPYYCWTRKVKGKTQTIALSKIQAQRLRTALATQRRVQNILSALYAMSKGILCSQLPGVPKRNRLQPK